MGGLGKHRLHGLRLARSLRHQSITQRAVVAAQLDRSVQTLVDRHRLGFEAIFDQVDLAFMLDRGIGIEPPLRFQAQHRIEIQSRRHPTMQVRGLSRLDAKAPVVERQITFQNLVGLRQRRSSSQTQFLDQTVLQRLKQPLDAPLGSR